MYIEIFVFLQRCSPERVYAPTLEDYLKSSSFILKSSRIISSFLYVTSLSCRMSVIDVIFVQRFILSLRAFLFLRRENTHYLILNGTTCRTMCRQTGILSLSVSGKDTLTIWFLRVLTFQVPPFGCKDNLFYNMTVKKIGRLKFLYMFLRRKNTHYLIQKPKLAQRANFRPFRPFRVFSQSKIDYFLRFSTQIFTDFWPQATPSIGRRPTPLMFLRCKNTHYLKLTN